MKDSWILSTRQEGQGPSPAGVPPTRTEGGGPSSTGTATVDSDRKPRIQDLVRSGVGEGPDLRRVPPPERLFTETDVGRDVGRRETPFSGLGKGL